MTLSTPQRYDVRTATSADLPLLRRWVGQPHWREWWGDPEKAVAEISAALESIETEPLIVELDGKAVAYIQSYDPHLEDGHPYQDQPFGTLGLDISIGPAELLGKRSWTGNPDRVHQPAFRGRLRAGDSRS
jgi:aminoglycoside 6'-N-acetyltransferase